MVAIGHSSRLVSFMLSKFAVAGVAMVSAVYFAAVWRRMTETRLPAIQKLANAKTIK
jgi:hypothetical protein